MSKVVLFYGDSITDCGRNREIHEKNTGCGYPTMVMGELGAKEPYQYTFHNRGISGNRVVDLFARIKVDAINLKPDYMSVLVGVNDAWHEYAVQNGVSAEKYELVYDLMLKELEEALPGIKFIILEPFVLPGEVTCNTESCPDRWEYLDKEVKLRAAAAKRVAEKHGAVFVPLQEMFDKVNADAPMGYWLRDGVHPTAAGHTLIKEKWLEAFEKIK